MIINGYEFIFTLADVTTDEDLGTFSSAKNIKKKLDEIKNEIPIENIMVWYGEKTPGEMSYMGSFWAKGSILDDLRGFMVRECKEEKERFLSKYIPEIGIPLKGNKRNQISDELVSHKQNLEAGQKLLCPHCWNSLDDCDCMYWPTYAVEIDESIATIITMLNQKGYKTLHCCGGHYQQNVAYIVFAYMYEFEVPEGWYRTFSGSIHQIERNDNISESEFAIAQENEMRKLKKWAEELPVLDVFYIEQ